jgi:hypothetical protein
MLSADIPENKWGHQQRTQVQEGIKNVFKKKPDCPPPPQKRQIPLSHD